MAALPVVTVGPFGGEGGTAWDDTSYTTVRQIVVQSGEFIDAIQVEYDNNGVSKWGNLHGGRGGSKHSINLKYPREYLVSIHGYYGSQDAYCSTVLQSITFQTNTNVYGPYGTERGVYFSFPPIIGKIVGFFGRYGYYLDALGVHIEPFKSTIVKTIGPFGGSGGLEWDDGVHTGVKELIITCDVDSSIDSITIKYDDNGESTVSTAHGNSGRGRKYTVTLDYPNEYLTSISGYIDRTFDFDFEVVFSLTINSNKSSYGPYGKEEGDYFTTNGTKGEIVGFFGRAGDHVNSIGAYVKA